MLLRIAHFENAIADGGRYDFRCHDDGNLAAATPQMRAVCICITIYILLSTYMFHYTFGRESAHHYCHASTGCAPQCTSAPRHYPFVGFSVGTREKDFTLPALRRAAQTPDWG